ncbi:243_t:CDS:1 [Paraglomus brasilianum]|uniref:243_t:CDS:1 n=1 Tax=Paraglomus brasilianum TaxID=144538 RepID=A0A9N9ANY8_9GLOM|nr:243_t:CDS:1 [Paraglomus brasilianum]
MSTPSSYSTVGASLAQSPFNHSSRSPPSLSFPPKITVPLPSNLNPKDYLPKKIAGSKSCNAFMIYRKVFVNELIARQLRFKMVEVSRWVSAQWKKEDEDVKNAYRQFARKVDKMYREKSEAIPKRFVLPVRYNAAPYPSISHNLFVPNNHAGLAPYMATTTTGENIQQHYPIGANPLNNSSLLPFFGLHTMGPTYGGVASYSEDLRTNAFWLSEEITSADFVSLSQNNCTSLSSSYVNSVGMNSSEGPIQPSQFQFDQKSF